VTSHDGEVLDTREVKKLVPLINDSPNIRYPIMGASWQPRGGNARHDAVAWGYARGADKMGVDLIQQTEVTDLHIEQGEITGVDTSAGPITAKQVACVTAGNSGALDCVVMSNAVHAYISQSDKGDLVIGAGVDAYNGYGQRGSLSVVEHCVGAIVEMFPAVSRIRMNRTWAGVVDTTQDECPIIGKTPVKGLYFNCGWGTGGFKATPGSGFVFAETIAKDEPQSLAAPFKLDLFYTGVLIDEHGAAGVAHQGV
jgi:sarcosine oxidase subunit beta